MPDQKIKYRRIAIIQFLRDKDDPQGVRLYEQLKGLEDTESDLIVTCAVATSKKEFLDAIDALAKDIKDPSLVTLHLDTHGCEDGIGTDRDNLISWHELYSHIRPINIKVHNTLMLIMSVCRGGAIMTCLEPQERAPFMAFIANTRPVLFSDTAKGFPLFYQHYRTPLDFPRALKALNGAIDFSQPIITSHELIQKTEFFVYSSQELFEQAMNPDRDKESFKKIALAQEYNDTTMTDDEKIEVARRMIINDANRYRAYYNFEDVLG